MRVALLIVFCFCITSTDPSRVFAETPTEKIGVIVLHPKWSMPAKILSDFQWYGLEEKFRKFQTWCGTGPWVIAKPILWSNTDTNETIKQVNAHNRVFEGSRELEKRWQTHKYDSMKIWAEFRCDYGTRCWKRREEKGQRKWWQDYKREACNSVKQKESKNKFAFKTTAPGLGGGIRI